MKSVAKIAFISGLLLGPTSYGISKELVLQQDHLSREEIQGAEKQVNIQNSYILQGKSVEELSNAVVKVGGSVQREFPIIDAISAVLTPSQLDALSQHSEISIQEDNDIKTMSSFRNQRNWNYSENDSTNNHIVQMVNAEKLHQWGALGQAVTIAIIDSGVNLGGKLGNSLFRDVNGTPKVPKKYDAITRKVRYTWNDDFNGHGTHVANIIGNTMRSDGFFNGIAPNAKLLPIKAFDTNGKGRYSTVLEALNWVYNNHKNYNIRVVNMSIGAPARTRYWEDPINRAVKKLWDKGVVIVASAGNNGKAKGITVPGNNPYVITVGAAAIDGFECQALTFTGNQSHILVDRHPDLRVRSGAISFWVKHTSNGREQNIFSQDANGYGNGGHLNIRLEASGKLDVRHQSRNATRHLKSNGPLSPNQWHHVVYSFGTQGMQLFVNGNLEQSNSSFKEGLNRNLENIVIGASAARRASTSSNTHQLENYFAGNLDELRIHNKQPSVEEVHMWVSKIATVPRSQLVAEWNANRCPTNENTLVEVISGRDGRLGAGADYVEEGPSMEFSDARIASFSSQGPTLDGFIKPEIVAPGTNIAIRLDKNPVQRTLKQYKNDNRYTVISGTSQAAAIVSGVAALVLTMDSSATPDQVKCAIMGSAKMALDDTGKPISPFKQGAGLVDAWNAAAGRFMAPSGFGGGTTSCANQGLDIKADIAGKKHFLGPVGRDNKGNFFIRLTNGQFLINGAHWSNGDMSLNGAHWSNGDVSMNGAHWSNGDMALNGAHWSNGDMALNGAHWSNGDIKMLGAHWSNGDMRLLGAHWSNGDFDVMNNRNIKALETQGDNGN